MNLEDLKPEYRAALIEALENDGVWTDRFKVPALLDQWGLIEPFGDDLLGPWRLTPAGRLVAELLRELEGTIAHYDDEVAALKEQLQVAQKEFEGRGCQRCGGCGFIPNRERPGQLRSCSCEASELISAEECGPAAQRAEAVSPHLALVLRHLGSINIEDPDDDAMDQVQFAITAACGVLIEIEHSQRPEQWVPVDASKLKSGEYWVIVGGEPAEAMWWTGTQWATRGQPPRLILERNGKPVPVPPTVASEAE